LFWWALFHGRERNYGAGVLYIFTTAVHSSILAALLTFSPSLWYPSYALTTFPWGLTPLEDQQLGGLIMWVPAGILYLLAGLAVFIAWLHTSEKSGRERQRYLPTAHSGLAGDCRSRYKRFAFILWWCDCRAGGRSDYRRQCCSRQRCNSILRLRVVPHDQRHSRWSWARRTAA
jgi:hypothetical protein